MTVPKISIIIPCYNRRELMGETFDSLQRQTFLDWEAVVVDDASQDGSLAEAQDYAARDARFRAFARQQSLKGASVCRNEGLRRAQGEYIIFLDSDDLLLETCLARRVQSMERNPAAQFGVYQAELFYRQVGDRRILWNVYTEGPDLPRFLSKDAVWDITGPIWRRDALMRLGGFDPALASFHDWDLHVRALIARLPYFKEGIRDHFYRNGASTGGAISDISCVQPEHLRSHEQMFCDTLRRLREASLLEADTRARVAGLFWWLAIRWYSTGKFSEAKRTWRRAMELGLCTFRHYWQGLVVLKLRKFRGGGRIGSLIQMTWPRQFYSTGSPYLHNAPVEPESHAAAPVAVITAG